MVASHQHIFGLRSTWVEYPDTTSSTSLAPSNHGWVCLTPPRKKGKEKKKSLHLH